jgi:urease accessory protein
LPPEASTQTEHDHSHDRGHDNGHDRGHDNGHDHGDASPHEHGEGDSPLPSRPLRVGVGGPVGSGKTALVAALCRALTPKWSVAVVTNDIYTTEDAQILLREAVLPADRVLAVQTGCCPHTAIRDDIAANLEAVEKLDRAHPGLDLVLVESGGDNLTATFSYGLVHKQIFVIDVAGGDKVPRKGGPGITLSDLLVVNKTDLARLVRADLANMRADTAAARPTRPFVFMSLVDDPMAGPVADWLEAQLLRTCSPTPS